MIRVNDDHPPTKGPLARRLIVGLALYAAMIGLALGVALLRGDSLVARPARHASSLPLSLVRAGLAEVGLGGIGLGGIGLEEPLASLLAGLLLAGLTVASTRLLIERTRWAKALRVELRASVEGGRSSELWLLAVASGVAEELLFRGALLPWIGLAASSLVFGAFHFVPTRTLAPWALWATLMGLLLGLVYEETGSLVGPIVAHAAINAVNLHRVARFDPALDPSAPLPSLVPKRRSRER